MSLLSWFRRPVRPRGVKPETDWEYMGCGPSCRFDHTVIAGCAYACEPEFPAPDEVSWVPEDGLWGFRRGQVCQAERVVLEALAVCSEGANWWEAASRVFGGAGVTCEASRAGLSATLAGEPAGTVPR